MNEISRRSFYHVDDNGNAAIVAEIVVEMNGQTVYLHGEWVDIVDEYYYEADTESLFDVLVRLNNATDAEEEAAADAERGRISEHRFTDDAAFKPYYRELKQMIQCEMKDHGIYGE